MRRQDFLSESESVPQQNAENERRPSGRHVNDGATGEIDGPDLRSRIPESIHPAIDAPDHVGDREINGEHPHRDKNKHGREFHPLRDRADDQCWCDDREHQLIHREDILRNPVRIIAVRVGIHAA